MKPHPLFAFRSKWDLTLPEASEFFDLHPTTLSGYEHGRFPMPEWLAQWLEDPMMSDDEIRRRVEDARRRAASSLYRTGRGNGNPVRAWRRQHRLTQVQAAKLLGVHPATLGAWELGDRPVPENIMRRIEKDES